MRGKKDLIVQISFFSCLVLAIIFFSSINAKANDEIETEIVFNLVDGVTINVDTSADVNEITLPANGVSYSSSDIQSISINNPEMMGAIKISVKGLLSNQLQASFPNAIISSIQELPNYSQGQFIDSYKIELTSGFFSLNESVEIDGFINGMLDSGAVINYTVPLQSYAGWNNTYMFQLPPTITYNKVINCDVKQDRIICKVFTLGQSNQKIGSISLKSINPTTSLVKNTSMNISFIIDCRNSETPSLNMQYNADAIRIDTYKILPSFISNVVALPADAIRLCVLNNFTSWKQIQNRTFEPIHKEVRNLIESSRFNQTLSTTFAWLNETTNKTEEPYNKSNMDIVPPISGKYLDDSIHFSILDATSRTIFGLVNAGAEITIEKEDVNFGDNFEYLSYPFNGTLKLPQNVLLNKKNDFVWDASSNISGSFSSENDPTYYYEDINTTILLDVESTDMNLLSFFTGKTELRLGMYLEETQKRHVTSLSEGFHLPPKVNLTLLNSDAFRLCVEENVFKENEINTFISNIADIFENRTKSLFHSLKGETRSERSVFEASLLWDKNISSMDEASPIIVTSSMHSSYPLSYSFSFLPPSFSVNPQNLTFESIPNQDVTYRMVFPKGTSIEISDTLNKTKIGTTEDGRVFFDIYFDSSEGNLVTNVHCVIHPSGLFIIGLLVPCIISILITILLFIVVYVIRKKRKNMHKVNHEEIPNEYEEQDYYIPPPPPSKRKRKK